MSKAYTEILGVRIPLAGIEYVTSTVPNKFILDWAGLYVDRDLILSLKIDAVVSKAAAELGAVSGQSIMELNAAWR